MDMPPSNTEQLTELPCYETLQELHMRLSFSGGVLVSEGIPRYMHCKSYGQCTEDPSTMISCLSAWLHDHVYFSLRLINTTLSSCHY